MLRRVIATSACLASILVVAACGAGDQAPSPTPGAPTTENSAAPPPPASQVENPKDMGAVAEDPCSGLTPDNLAAVGAGTEPPVIEESEWGQGICVWDDSNASVSVTPDTVNGGGFGRIQSNKDLFTNYTELDIGGHPAAKVDASDVTCGVIVGVNDHDTLMIDGAVYSDEAKMQGRMRNR